MTFLQIINLIKDTALAQPNVNTFVRNFLDLNREDTVYSAVVLQDRDGLRDRISEQDWNTYTFHLGYVDRLTFDESNRDDIFSTGINIINNIVASIRDTWFPDIEVNIIDRFQTFDQRFTASCAGVYVVLSIQVPVSDCVDGEQTDLYDKYEAKITENGHYHFVPDGRPVDEIDITIDVSGGGEKPEESLVETISSNGDYHYDPTPGSVFSEADITVSVPETVLEKYQGSYDVRPTSGNIFLDPSDIDADGFSDVAIEVGVMTTGIFKTLTSNGVYHYEAGDQEVGDAYIDTVDVTIDVHPSNTLSRRYTTNGEKTITGEFNGGTVNVDVHPSDKLVETITNNGSYSYPGEYAGAEITVAVSAAKPEETLTETITSNGSYHYEPSAGSVFSEADITVDCPGPKEEQSLVEEISENGHFEWHPDPGKVFSDTEIFVDVHPSSSLSKTYTTNGTKTITGEFNGGSITINVHPTAKLSKTYTENGTYNVSGEWKDAAITVAVPTNVNANTLRISQTEYDNLSVKDPDTIYLIYY